MVVETPTNKLDLCVYNSYFTHAVSETHCIKTVSVDDWFNVHLMRYTSVKIQTEKHHLSLRLSEQRPGSFVIPHVGHPIHLGKFDFFHQLCIWLKFQIISLYLGVTIVPLSPFLGGYFIPRRDVPMSRLPTKRFTHRSQRLNVPKADDGGGFTADCGRGLQGVSHVEVGGGWWGCVDLWRIGSHRESEIQKTNMDLLIFRNRTSIVSTGYELV